MSDWNNDQNNQHNDGHQNQDSDVQVAGGENTHEDFLPEIDMNEVHKDDSSVQAENEREADELAALQKEIDDETATESSDSDEEEDDEYDADVPNDTSPRGGDFRWADLRKAVEFTRLFMEMPRFQRDQFRYLLGIAEESSVVDILQALTPPAGKIASIVFITDYIEKISSGTLGFMDGIRISSELNELPDDSKRSIFATLNALSAMLPKDDTTVATLRYRKNMNVNDVFMLLNTGVEQLDTTNAVKLLSNSQELLSTWVD